MGCRRVCTYPPGVGAEFLEYKISETTPMILTSDGALDSILSLVFRKIEFFWIECHFGLQIVANVIPGVLQKSSFTSQQKEYKISETTRVILTSGGALDSILSQDSRKIGIFWIEWHFGLQIVTNVEQGGCYRTWIVLKPGMRILFSISARKLWILSSKWPSRAAFSRWPPFLTNLSFSTRRERTEISQNSQPYGPSTRCFTVIVYPGTDP